MTAHLPEPAPSAQLTTNGRAQEPCQGLAHAAFSKIYKPNTTEALVDTELRPTRDRYPLGSSVGVMVALGCWADRRGAWVALRGRDNGGSEVWPLEARRRAHNARTSTKSCGAGSDVGQRADSAGDIQRPTSGDYLTSAAGRDLPGPILHHKYAARMSKQVRRTLTHNTQHDNKCIFQLHKAPSSRQANSAVLPKRQFARGGTTRNDRQPRTGLRRPPRGRGAKGRS